MKSRPRMKKKGYDLQGYANGKYSDESGDDDIDLPIRRVYKPQNYIEVQVQDGDTLQAIALRFNCTVSTIKRANNILRDNEIFAKRVLKIPAAAFSLLTESIPLVHTSGTNSPTRANEAKQIKDNSEIVPLTSDNDFQQKLIVASVNSSHVSQSKYFSTLSEDNVRPGTSKDVNIISTSNIPIDEQNNVHLEELTSPLLGHQQPPKSVETVLIREFTSKGADFGIKWIHLLVCILLLCFFIPLVYVIHIAEHPEKYHHHLNDHH